MDNRGEVRSGGRCARIRRPPACWAETTCLPGAPDPAGVPLGPVPLLISGNLPLVDPTPVEVQYISDDALDVRTLTVTIPTALTDIPFHATCVTICFTDCDCVGHVLSICNPVCADQSVFE